MYNYKLRGRPDDPRNKLASECRNALSQSIKVNGMFGTIPEKELMRTRQHYAEYVKSYEDQHFNKSVGVLRKGSTVLNDKKNRDTKRTPLNSSKQLTTAKSQIVKSLVQEKPLSRRPSKDEFSKINIYESRLKDKNAVQLVERLRQMEEEYSRMVDEQGSRPNIKNLIEQTANDVDVATTQLEEIKKMLKRKNGRAVNSMSDLQSVTRSTTTVADQFSADDMTNMGRNCEQWRKKNAVDAVKSKMTDSKKRKMVLTLNTLNEKIQEMQDKYFSAPKNKFVSLDDLKKQERFKKHIQVIYENEDFDPDKEISKMLLMPPKEDGCESLKTISPNAKNSSSGDQSFCSETGREIKVVSKNSKKSDGAIINKRVRFSSDISSDNYLYNREMQPQTVDYSLIESNVEEYDDEVNLEEQSGPIYSSLNSISITESRNSINRDVEIKRNLKAVPSVNQNLKSKNSRTTSTSTMTNTISITNERSALDSIRESVLKSDYLQRQFANMSSTDLRLPGRGSLSTPGLFKKNVNSIPNPQEYFKQRNERADSLRKAYLDESIRRQQKVQNTQI